MGLLNSWWDFTDKVAEVKGKIENAPTNAKNKIKGKVVPNPKTVCHKLKGHQVKKGVCPRCGITVM